MSSIAKKTVALTGASGTMGFQGFLEFYSHKEQFNIRLLLRDSKKNRKNSSSPRVTAEATVVTKRTHVWGDHSRTDYYATFQFESGDRLELEVPYSQFGYLVEGDNGKLTFQGTRFLEFTRT